MRKDFDDWNKFKKNIHSAGQKKFYHPREIWWCSMGVNVGVEADGKGEDYSRPIVILPRRGKAEAICAYRLSQP